MNYIGIVTKMFGAAALIAAIIWGMSSVIELFNPNNVKNFEKKGEVKEFEMKKLVQQSINHKYILMWKDLDTNCRYLTMHNKGSYLLPLDCGIESDKEAGFVLVKKDKSFFVIKDNWTDKKYIVYENSIVEYKESKNY